MVMAMSVIMDRGITKTKASYWEKGSKKVVVRVNLEAMEWVQL